VAGRVLFGWPVVRRWHHAVDSLGSGRTPRRQRSLGRADIAECRRARQRHVHAENSAGSDSGVDIESVELAERSRFGTTFGEAENLGSLSPGDEVTLAFPAEFDESGS